ncbi:LSU ribosomal protein L30E [Methanocella conradii HZ254]|jgi:large subunit ribosomal protein L30e|uniref:Large ribosomal subunit protein eL30 n=1 Tax=Methanocella conradii (strain DSM 24694 / JCM 17849 / CGMCC 1.5162 / HZ254) TaxID=1041930 RepID=H8I868_METCZ|nr:50S ribosomal protein L30e [Methanocella conradii]AFD00886.1 LSU ribosomal protein L30E [Methanocella conradii HZ254]MDI6897567.1 50S ribosomal protein L30e [Methanocella conradii]
MQIDLDKSLRSVMRTGKVLVGTRQAIKASKRGVAKLVIVASNCPGEVKKQIKESNVPVYEFPGMSVDLGPMCGKPFIVSALTILDAGESDIMALARGVQSA